MLEEFRKVELAELGNDVTEGPVAVEDGEAESSLSSQLVDDEVGVLVFLLRIPLDGPRLGPSAEGDIIEQFGVDQLVQVAFGISAEVSEDLSKLSDLRG